MAEKKALYQKYRPHKLNQLIGQPHVVQTLSNAVKNGRLKHAYLFCGIRGTGKTTLARILALVMNCEDSPSIEYDISDGICKSIISGVCPDVVELDAASNSSIDEIRELRKLARTNPVVGKKKVFIIDEVHCLRKDAASALLKILEEPPKNTIFILCIDGEEKVYDGDGFISIQDLEVGSKILTKDGYARVKNKFFKGKDKVYRIKTKNGTTLNLTKNHEVEVYDGMNFIWKRADNISENDYIPVQHSYNTNKGLGFSEEECELIGRIVGDGYYTYKKLGVLFNKKEWEYGKSLLEKIGVSFSFIDKKSVFEVNIHNRNGDLKNRWGMEDYTRGNKKLPSSVWFMNKKEFDFFMKGLIGADGHIDEKYQNVSITQNNIFIVNELRKIMMSHGIISTIHYTKRKVLDNSKTTGIKKGTYDSYQILLRKKTDIVPLNKAHRNFLANNFKECVRLKYKSGYSEEPNYNTSRDTLTRLGFFEYDRNLFYEKFDSIEFLGEKDVYDLEMDNKSESFIVNGITVHNCTTDPQKMLKTILSRCQRFDLRKVSTKELVKHLKYICEQEGVEKIEEEALSIIARAGTGSVRDSISLLDAVISNSEKEVTLKITEDTINYTSMSFFYSLTDHIIKGEKVKAFIHLKKAMSIGKDPQEVFHGFLEYIHSTMLSKTLGTDSFLYVEKSILNDWREQRDKTPIDDFLVIYNTIEQAMLDLHYKPRVDLTLDTCIIHLLNLFEKKNK